MIACSNTLQTKKIITKAKKIQNQQRINRQTRQTQQKDARQNIINKRRGMQVTVQAMLKLNTIFLLPSWMMNNYLQTLIWSINLYSVTVWCFICWTVLWPAIKSLSIRSNTLTGLQKVNLYTGKYGGYPVDGAFLAFNSWRLITRTLAHWIAAHWIYFKVQILLLFLMLFCCLLLFLECNKREQRY